MYFFFNSSGFNLYAYIFFGTSDHYYRNRAKQKVFNKDFFIDFKSVLNVET